MPPMPRQLQGDKTLDPKTPTVTLQGYLERVIDERSDHLEQLINERDRQYDQRFQDSKDAVTAALSAAKEANTKADLATEKRFEGVNEFRAALSDQQANLMGRSEAVAMLKALDDKIEAVRTVNEGSRQALKSASDERLENVNKRLAAHDLAIVSSVPQATFDLRYAELQKMINDLRETRSAIQGQEKQAATSTSDVRWVIATIMAVIFGMVGAFVGLAGTVGLIITLIMRANGQ